MSEDNALLCVNTTGSVAMVVLVEHLLGDTLEKLLGEDAEQLPAHLNESRVIQCASECGIEYIRTIIPQVSRKWSEPRKDPAQ